MILEWEFVNLDLNIKRYILKIDENDPIEVGFVIDLCDKASQELF